MDWILQIQGDTLFVSAKTKIELLYAKWSELFTEDDWKSSVNGTPFYLLIFVKLKARLVAKGFSQRSGIDFGVDGTAVGNPFLQLQRDFYSSCAFAFDL